MVDLIDAVDQSEQGGAALRQVAGRIRIGRGRRAKDERFAELPIIGNFVTQRLVQGGFGGFHGGGALLQGAIGLTANVAPFLGLLAGGLGVGREQIIAQNDGGLIDAGADLFEQLDAAQVGIAHFAGVDVDVVNSEDGVRSAGQDEQQ
ncbi:MAG: hypothetical protein M3N41_09630 [Acidobacteriota bacterium]|nr:hypothetical protein [Acidobacteriota bacterium]